MTRLDIQFSNGSYAVLLEAGRLQHLEQDLPQGKRFVVVTDAHVLPFVTRWLSSFPIFTIPCGEEGKTFAVLQKLLAFLLAQDMTRDDMLIAFGGGAVCDLTGFAASVYMRGIRWVSVPTTLLAMVDASIGGKTAINFQQVKNVAGTFWPPALVVMDTDLLRSLSPRLLASGMAEAVKAGMIKDPELFALFERDDYREHMHEIITRALRVKKDIVEQDEKENGSRRLLNFGHTFGHAYEVLQPRYLHGECVAMGMMKMVDDPMTKARLQAVLERLHLPLYCQADPEQVAATIRHDKKARADCIDVVRVKRIGTAEIVPWTFQQIRKKAGE